MNRAATLEDLRTRPEVDVLVIGGGINGVGVWRDLALQGVRALLVEQADFCSGASAASSHMIHGGIRYLENGEFRLVREAVQERNRLLQYAPAHVQPLPTVIPIFKYISGVFNAPLKFLGLRQQPAERGALVIRLGLWLYDALLGRGRVTPRHRFYGRQAARVAFPALHPAAVGAAEYSDAFMPHPERLCWDVLRDGLGQASLALNYMAAMGADGHIVRLRDGLTGETLPVRPRLVVNAAGPWVDRVNAALGRPSALIGGTKGSHLVLENPELLAALQGREFFFENADGRIVLLCPLGGRVLLGTTDLRIEDADAARCTPDEVEYLLGMVGRVFPGISVGEQQIVFRFSGVRPLPRTPDAGTGQISRDHQIVISEAGNEGGFPVWSLVGGKWTTFRAFSEQVTDRLLARLRLPRVVSTRTRAISASRPELLQDGVPISKEVIAAICREEAVEHLDDLALRRTSLAMQGALDAEMAGWLAEWAAGPLGWDAARQAAELARLRQILTDRYGVRWE